MKIKKVRMHAWFLGLLAAGSILFAGCQGSAQHTKLFVWIQGAAFHQGAVPSVNPCPSDYPLNCPGTGKCCATGYPYLCSSLDECYSSSPPCSGYNTCSTSAPLITSVTVSKTSITPGGTWTVFTVSFTVTASVMITGAIIYVEELGGYFELPVNAAQNQDGFIQFPLGLLDAAPDASGCISGGQPCYAPVPQGTSSLDEVISLLSGSGDVSSPYNENVLVGGAGGGGGNGSYCYSTSACIPSVMSNSCECSGSTSQTQCVSGHPACSAAGGPCGDGTHACCGGETCIENTCVQGCGQCTGIGCQ